VNGNRSIGEVAAELGLDPDTIRYYERVGVLPPAPRDPAGRRQYPDDHVHLLEVLLRLKETGMPLADVATFTRLVQQDPHGVPERLQLLRAHRERVLANRAALDAALALIDRKIGDYAARAQPSRPS
jgi:DNA-binding transcriptional MerR regulator